MEMNNNDIAFHLICHLIEMVEAGEMVEEAGLNSEQIMALRSATVADLKRIAVMQGLVTIQFDPRKVGQAIYASRSRQEASDDLCYLARAGASAAILSEIMRISLDEAGAHIEALGVVRTPGRPSMPNADIRDAIHQWWSTNLHLAVRDRWIGLHKCWPDYTVATLYAVINEFNIGE